MHRCVIVVPCYNEATRIDTRAFLGFAEQHGDIGFVMVNDGSSDNTLNILRRLAQTNGCAFRVLELPENVGKAAAVRRGMLHALDTGADFVGYWDADLATPLQEIPRLLKAFDDQPAVQLVMGSRVRMLGHQIDRHLLRHVLGRCFAAAVSLMLQLPAYDTQCGAKMFRAGPVVRDIFSERFQTDWIFDVELLVRLNGSLPAGMKGISACVREIPLREWRDVPGSKLGPADFLRSFFELGFLAGRNRRPNQSTRREAPSHGLHPQRVSRRLKRTA